MFGDVLKKLRTQRGITQRDLGIYLNVSPSTIGMYEQSRRTPDIEILQKIAKYFKVSIDYLVGDSLLELPFIYHKPFQEFMEVYFPLILKYLGENPKIMHQKYYNISKKLSEIIQGEMSYDCMDSWRRQELVKALFEIKDASIPILHPKIELPYELVKNIPHKNYLGINIENLIPFPKKTGIKIPVLGEIIAGIPLEAHQDILGYEEIPIEQANNGEYFGLKVKGDSMEPRIKEGDILIIRKQSDVDSGDIAVVMINGEVATVKQLHKAETGITLQAWNPVYPIKFFSNKEIETLPVMILGKVVELRGKF